MEPADDLAIQGHWVTAWPDNVFVLAPHWTKWSARGLRRPPVGQGQPQSTFNLRESAR